MRESVVRMALMVRAVAHDRERSRPTLPGSTNVFEHRIQHTHIERVRE
jgi:hypothetical protein